MRGAFMFTPPGDARQALGLSAEGFARAVRVESGRTVRRWEAGERDIPGPIITLLEIWLDPRYLLHG